MKTHMNGKSLRTSLRILWAITRNDLVAALKNKNVVTNILLAMAVAIFYKYLPAIGALDEPDMQTLRVYDAGQSGLVPLLEESELSRMRVYDTEEEMRASLAHSDQPELGLVIPADFDQAIEGDDPLVLQGFVMNWLAPEKAVEQKQLAETELFRLVGRPVTVEIEGNLVYPDPESHGMLVTASFGLVYLILMTALPTIPYLFIEEKQSRTMDALMVSPASAWQIVGGKALTGMIYTLLGAVVGLFVFRELFIHWGLVFPVILLGSLFTVSLGLLVGIRTENREQLMMGMWILLIPLVLPVFLSIMEPLIPHVLVQIFRFIPTTTLFNLLRITMAGQIPWGGLLLWSGWLVAWVIGLLMVVTVQVRRLDRQDERAQSRLLGLPEKAAVNRSGTPAQGYVEDQPPVSQPARLAAAETAILAERKASAAPSGWKITLAIAKKDMREALKNKVFLSILVGTGMMAIINTALPLLAFGSGSPSFAIYNPGGSERVNGLVEREDLRVGFYESYAQMEEQVVDSLGSVMGIVLPADLDEKVQAGEEIVVAGFADHTSSRKKTAEWSKAFEQAMRELDSRVSIRIETNVLYPRVDSFGQYSLIAIVLAVVVFTIGASLVPLLFIVEKETHTLDALLVSPARPVQVVVGKALAGAVYCLLAGGILGLVNLRMFVHLDIALLALLLTTIFAVSVGLLLGVLSKNPTNAGILGSLLLLALMALTVFGLVEVPWVPDSLRTLLAWLPGPAVLDLFRIALAGEIPAQMLLASTGSLLAVSLLLYGLVAWWVRRERVG